MTSAIGWAALVAALLLSAPATAQSSGQGPLRDEPQGMSIGERPSVKPAESWTETEIIALARALRDMAAVMNEGRADLAAAEDDATRSEVEEKTFVGMLNAVEKSGLTVDRYNALIAAMNRDPELREQVAALLAPEAAEEPGAASPEAEPPP